MYIGQIYGMNSPNNCRVQFYWSNRGSLQSVSYWAHGKVFVSDILPWLHMSALVSQITGNIQALKHWHSVRGIHRWLMDSPYEGASYVESGPTSWRHHDSAGCLVACHFAFCSLSLMPVSICFGREILFHKQNLTRIDIIFNKKINMYLH